MGFTKVAGIEYPKTDNSTVFNKLTPSASINVLLQNAGPECATTLGRINITDEQYQEIKEFTDDLVKGLTKQYDIYLKCFDWVTTNVKYKYERDNDPYPVFKNKEAICEGYSNLLCVMLHTQGVPAMLANGYLQSRIFNGMLTGMGHAWAYVCCDGEWYVSDPTNKGQNKMAAVDTYKSWLEATSLDVILFKMDDCWLNFNDCFLNICKVTTEDKVFVTPYSINGCRISCFNPTEELPENVRELYIGENIMSLGEGIVGLGVKAPNVEYAAVAPDNKYLLSHSGAVYYSNLYTPADVYKVIDKNVPAYIPAGLKRLELKAVNVPASGIVYDKNTISEHKGIEEIVFPKETVTISAYAIEKCPNLKVAYVPEGATVQTGAFTGVHSTFNIVYTK